MAADEKQGLAAWHSVVRLPEFPVEARSTALIVIDLTLQQASRHHGLCARIRDAGLAGDLEYYLARMEGTVVPNVARLADAFRRTGSPVVYTRCVSLRGDGSDLLAIGTRSAHAFLRLAHLGGGDHLHRLGDLPGVLHTPDFHPDLFGAGHQ